MKWAEICIQSGLHLCSSQRNYINWKNDDGDLFTILLTQSKKADKHTSTHAPT